MALYQSSMTDHRDTFDVIFHLFVIFYMPTAVEPNTDILSPFMFMGLLLQVLSNIRLHRGRWQQEGGDMDT